MLRQSPGKCFSKDYGMGNLSDRHIQEKADTSVFQNIIKQDLTLSLFKLIALVQTLPCDTECELFKETCTMIHLTNISKQYGSQILFFKCQLPDSSGHAKRSCRSQRNRQDQHFPPYYRRRGMRQRRNHQSKEDRCRLFFPGHGRHVRSLCT